MIRRSARAARHYDAAVQHLAAHDPAGALRSADSAIGLDPNRAPAHHARGVALSDLGRHSEAVESFRTVLALDPTATYEHYRIAVQLMQLERTDDALAEATAASAAAPTDPAPHAVRGAVLFEAGRIEDALVAFTRACDLAPEVSQLRYDRAVVLRASGRAEDAVAEFDLVLAAADGPVDALMERGVTLAVAGRLDEALTDLAGAPDHPESAVWSAAIRWHRGDAPAARELFARAADGFAERTWEDTPRRRRALRLVTECALGRHGLHGDDTTMRARPGPESRVTVPALFDLLSRPPLPGVEHLARRLLGS